MCVSVCFTTSDLVVSIATQEPVRPGQQDVVGVAIAQSEGVVVHAEPVRPLQATAL